MVSRLQALFPPASDDDLLPVLTAEQQQLGDRLTVSKTLVEKVLERLPRQSAGAFTLWSFDLLQQMTTLNSAVVDRVVKLVNTILRGNAGSAKVWCRSRVIALDKPDGGGLRPIAIGEPLYRLATRCLMASIARRAAAALAPWQWGIGLSGGAEAIAHGCQFAAAVALQKPDLGLGFQQIDFANAYNTVRRRPIHVALEEQFPELLNFFHWSYGSPGELFLSNGQPIGHSSTGVRQGDPLGPLFFCLALQPTLRSLQQVSPQAHLFAYMDDITIIAPVNELPRLLSETERQGRRIGLALNRRKSYAWDPGDSASSDPGGSVRSGVKTLGTPTGTVAYQRQFVVQQCERYRKTLAVLPDLDCHVAFSILRACVNARPVYLARTTRPQISSDTLQEFDKAVDDTLLKICQVTRSGLSETSQLIRHLPVKHGGLGLRRLGSICTLAYTASVLAGAQHLFTRQRSFVMDLIVPHARPALNPTFDAVRGVQSRFVTADRQLKVWPVNGADAVTTPLNIPSQKDLTKDDDKESLESLKQSLASDDQFGSAWFLSGASKEASSWLNFYVEPVQLLHIKPDAFRSGLIRRGLLNPPPHADRVVRRTLCRLCQETSGDPRFHALSCTQIQDKRLRRHDRVVNAIAYFLSRQHGTAAVTKEYTIPGSNLRADIRVCDPSSGGVYLLDITVINPACKTYVEKTDCVREEDAAGNLAFDKKMEKYEPHLRAAGLSVHAFIPVVFEATGRLNDKSRYALYPILPDEDRAGSRPARPPGMRWFHDPENPSELPKVIRFTLRRISAILVDWAEEMQKTYAAAVQELEEPCASEET